MNKTLPVAHGHPGPEWEAMKATRRSISHHAAVAESARITKLQWGLMGKMDAAAVELGPILKTLTRKRIPFVLTGTHGIGGWTGRPRATHDIDLLVKAGRNHARVVKAIKELYPQLEVRVFQTLTAFFVPGERESVIDVALAYRPDNAETLAHPVWTEDKKLGIRYRIPALENALANKYGAMMSVTRESRKRRQDILDFELMIKHSMDEGQEPIDLERLEALGELVWPGSGAKELLRLVQRVKDGGIIELSSLHEEV